ncbi:MAG TPA: hypothetical protein VIH15_05490 [Casimicrobiaceae bacterium]|jgi:hypothetical protein
MRYVLLALAICGVIASDASAALVEKWGPTWSEVTGSRYHRAILNRRPAIVKSVDGRDYLDRIVKIEPGKREITVQSPSRKGFRGSDAQMQLDIAPCKRYYLNAQFASGAGVEWKPVVDYVEPIAGCKVDTAKK